MKLSTISYRLTTFVVVGCVTLARGLVAEGNSSLSDSKNEDASVTASSLLAQNEELRRELSLSRETVQTLTNSLAKFSGNTNNTCNNNTNGKLVIAVS